MTKYTRRISASLVVAGALIAGCKSEPKQGPDSTALAAFAREQLPMLRAQVEDAERTMADK